MEDQLKLLQQGKNKSDMKMKAIEDNIAKILAAIHPPILPVIQLSQSQQSIPMGPFSQISHSAAVNPSDNRSSIQSIKPSLHSWWRASHKQDSMPLANPSPLMISRWISKKTSGKPGCSLGLQR